MPSNPPQFLSENIKAFIPEELRGEISHPESRSATLFRVVSGWRYPVLKPVPRSRRTAFRSRGAEAGEKRGRSAAERPVSGRRYGCGFLYAGGMGPERS